MRDRFLADPRMPTSFEALYSVVNAEVWHSTQPYNEELDRPRLVRRSNG